MIDMLKEAGHFDRADVYIDPPSDGAETDGDSGDEDTGPDLNNLSARQLRAPSSATLQIDGQRKELGAVSSDEDERQPSTSRPIRVTKSARPKRHWEDGDLRLESPSPFPWDDSHVHVLGQDLTPKLVFEMLFDDALCDFIVEESRRYAAQKGNHTFTLTRQDLRGFFGICLISGYAPVPRRRLYWSSDKDVYNAAIAEAMSRNRFEEIVRYIHLANNNTLPKDDRYAKVRPLFTALNEKFLSNFKPTRMLSVDESMIRYYGPHPMRQFIRGKPIRFGYKMWSMCTASGYCIQIEPYAGAEMPPTKNQHLGVGGSVVRRLASKLPRNGYIIHTDNFFTSIPLMESLREMNIGLTGTMRSNRVEDCPLTKVDEFKKRPRGTFEHRFEKNIGCVIARWRDNNIVTVGSTVHPVKPLVKATRYSRAERKRVQIDLPSLVQRYNESMGGVDQMDHNIADYRVGVRCRKWWWPIFTFMLDVAVHNAYQIYRASAAQRARPLDHLGFRREVAKVYLGQITHERSAASHAAAAGPRCPITAEVSDDIRFDGKEHYITARATQRRCRVCHKNTKRMCSKCQVSMHDKCFMAFHTS